MSMLVFKAAPIVMLAESFKTYNFAFKTNSQEQLKVSKKEAVARNLLAHVTAPLFSS